MVLPRFISVVITWMPPLEPNGFISAYEVTYRIGDMLTNTTVEAPSTKLNVVQLPPKTTVSEIAVTAITGAGRGEITRGPNVTTLKEGKFIMNTNITLQPSFCTQQLLYIYNI